VATQTVNYEYDKASNRTEIEHPGLNWPFEYHYDALNRLTSITEVNNNDTEVVNYSYDALGRRTGRGQGKAITYAYHDDSMPRQISIAGLAAGGTDLSWTFGFDKANQMTSRLVSDDTFQWQPKGNSNEAYSRNGLNQYTTVSANPYDYDANGSLTDTNKNNSSDGWAYIYDAENRLVSATNKATGSVTSYAYDPPCFLWVAAWRARRWMVQWWNITATTG